MALAKEQLSDLEYDILMKIAVEGQLAHEDGFYFLDVGTKDTVWIKFGHASHWRPEPKPPEGVELPSPEEV